MTTAPNPDHDQLEGSVAPHFLGRKLGLTLAELAKLVGVPRRQIKAAHAKPRAEAALRPLARILSMATEMMGEDEVAVWFIHNPIPGFSGKTARDLVEQGRASEVLDYLGAVKAGIHV
jgi:uncharacterized protein (DUF2384 family)